MSSPFQWENVSVVGKGGSSTVYKAVMKPAGNFVAVKQIDIDGLSREQINGIKGEIETMRNLSHPHILSYLGTQQSPHRVFIFLEYADRGSLRQYYQQHGPLSEAQISYCLRGIVSGLDYLHRNGIAHRDIKCANCLLNSLGVVKVADFGASKRFESDSIVSGLKGTPHWMAPEVIKGTQMTTGWIKADVWSLGCTVVEMATAKVPYAEYDNPMTAMYKIASGEIPSLVRSKGTKGTEALKGTSEGTEASKGTSEAEDQSVGSVATQTTSSADLECFVRYCCAVDPVARPDVQQLSKHDLLTKEGGVMSLFDPESVGEAGRVTVNADGMEDGVIADGKESDVDADGDVKADELEGSAAAADEESAPTVNAPDGFLSRSRTGSSSMRSIDDEIVAHVAVGVGGGLDGQGGDLGGDLGSMDLLYEDQGGYQLIPPDSTFQGCVAEETGLGEQAQAPEPPLGVLGTKAQPRGRSGSSSGGTSGSRSHIRGRARQMGIISTPLPISTSEQHGIDTAVESPEDMDEAPTPCMYRNGRDGGQLGLSRTESHNKIGDSDGSTGADENSIELALQDAPAKQPVRTLADASRAPSTKSLTGKIAGNTEVPAEPILKDIPKESALTLVPNFEEAAETYKAMMQKYSPRPSPRPADAGSKSSDSQSSAARVGPEKAGGRGAIASPTVHPSKSGGKTESPQAYVEPTVVGGEPTVVGGEPTVVGGGEGDAAAIPSAPRPKQKVPKHSIAKELTNLQSPAGVRNPPMAISGDRPFAPLSGEKLRLHSFSDAKKHSPSDLSRPDRLGQSAAVRRFAAQELREVDVPSSGAAVSGGVYRTGLRRGKGVFVHHTTKRTRGLAPNNQLASNSGNGHNGATGARSQSAGVTLSYEGGSKRTPRQLPPVYGIAPIHEGRPLISVGGAHGGMGLSRYIQSAPAVSRSVSLPPIDQPKGKWDGANGGGGVMVNSQTPTEQPKLHRFGQAVPAAALHESFAHAMQNYTTKEGQSGLPPGL